MPQPAIFQFINNVGIEISEGQIHNLLIGEAKGYGEQSEAILSAGLQEAPYIPIPPQELDLGNAKEASVSQQGKEQVSAAYDALIARQVVSLGVRAVLDAFKDHREGLLKALDLPGLSLNNNDSERDIRGMMKFRNISGSTNSEKGRTSVTV